METLQTKEIKKCINRINVVLKLIDAEIERQNNRNIMLEVIKKHWLIIACGIAGPCLCFWVLTLFLRLPTFR